jgi:hypothetical protein
MSCFEVFWFHVNANMAIILYLANNNSSDVFKRYSLCNYIDVFNKHLETKYSYQESKPTPSVLLHSCAHIKCVAKQLGLTPFSSLVNCLVDRLLVDRDFFSRAVAKHLIKMVVYKTPVWFTPVWVDYSIVAQSIKTCATEIVYGYIT